MDKFLSIFFKSALFFCLLSPGLHAAQWAKVVSKKAIIFADPVMSSPIGYFKQGQKIRVGEVPRNKGRVLPTVYKERVVYVRIVDLETSKDLSLVRTATERMKDREAKEALSSSWIGLGANVYGASASGLKSVEEVQEFEDSGAGIFLGGVSLNGGRRNLEKDYYYKVSFDYLSGSKGKTNVSLILLGAGAGYDLFKSARFNLSLFGLVELVPWAQYDVDSLFSVNGYGIGLNSGLESSMKITKNWSVEALAGYRYLKLFGFKMPESSSSYTIEEDFSPSLHGLALAGGISYHW